MKNSKPNSIGVVISTYNNPRWLEKTLWGYMCQTCLPNEVIIADDGSGEETRKLIEQIKLEAPFAVKHVWHEDNGFLKNVILNKAIVAAESDYLIFTDQDCVPRKDFVETHLLHSDRNYFLSGGYFKLPMDISEAITRENIEAEEPFSLCWLRKRGLRLSFKSTKLCRCSWYGALMNTLTPAKASWNGCNSSSWRHHLLDINGYNETMGYGGEDRELGERLVTYGLKPCQIRYSAAIVHLDHKRPYKDEGLIALNKQIRRNTRNENITFTPDGIEKM